MNNINGLETMIADLLGTSVGTVKEAYPTLKLEFVLYNVIQTILWTIILTVGGFLVAGVFSRTLNYYIGVPLAIVLVVLSCSATTIQYLVAPNYLLLKEILKG